MPDGQAPVDMLQHQFDFVFSQNKEVLFSGAFGAGKTRALCWKVRRHAQEFHHNAIGLFRKTRTALVRTTLRTLLLPEGELPPVLPPGTYEHRASESTIYLPASGSTIIYGGFDNPQAIASSTLGMVAIDEAIEIDADEYMMAVGRLRLTTDPYRQIVMATNPGAPSHFLFDRFISANHMDRYLIQCSSFDNPFLPKDYLGILSEFTGTRRQRYVEGQWVAFEGAVYGEVWNRAVHMVHREGPWVDVQVWIDEGYTNPQVHLLVGMDSDGRLHVLDEWHRTKQLPEDCVDALVAWLNTPHGKCNAYIHDPSAAGLAASMRARGLRAVSANNEVKEGIRAVMERLRVQRDGLPRLTFEPHCEHTGREFEAYVWDKSRDVPVKEMDHAPDAVRYGVSYNDRGRIAPHVSVASDGRATSTAEQRPAGPRSRSSIPDTEDEALWTR